MLSRGALFVLSLVVALGLVWLLLARADICRPGCPPLHVAARHGDTAPMARLLAKGADVNARTQFGTTPLHLAAGAGHTEAAAFLLDHGAHVDGAAGAQQGHTTPLFDAASCRDARASVEVTRLLLRRGANPNATVPGGQTPLIFAAMRGRAEVIDLLLAAGASANARGVNGRTPLHHAVKAGSMEAVQLLVDAGALPDEQDDAGVTPLRLARTRDIAELLISHGAGVNHLCGDGWTPLMAAASAGDPRLVECLLCAGADPDAPGVDGWTALHYAAASGAAEAADLLLIASADPNAETSDGRTPLSLATDPDTTEIIRARGGRGPGSARESGQGSALVPVQAPLARRAEEPTSRPGGIQIKR